MTDTDTLQRPSSLISTDDAAAYLGLHPQTLWRFRAESKGPAYYRLGPGKIVYDRSDLDAWRERQRVVPGQGQ